MVEMTLPGSTPLKEYYLWRKKVDTRFPWMRQHLNSEFLKYEQKRIKELWEWYIKFKKKDNGDIGEASFYIIPIELPSSWKAAIADYGNYNYVGLSALINSPQISLVGLISYSIKQPEEYRLIRIIKSERTIIFNKKLNKAIYVVKILDWEYLPSDYIYVDVPYEKRIIKNIIAETLIHDDQISLSFQCPIISAPYNGTYGGISLSSISASSSFAKELLRTISQIVPPEYRAVRPPKSVYQGFRFSHYGIKFRLAERPYSGTNLFSSVYAKEYSRLLGEQSNRHKFKGEYSIFATFNPDVGSYSKIMKELLKNFALTEVTLPYEIDKFPEADVDLTSLKREINEDLWAQIVYSKQFNPAINSNMHMEFHKIIKLLRKDLDIQLSDTFKQEISRNYLIDSMLHRMQYNLERIAQSIARSDEKEELEVTHFKNARWLILNNFEQFLDNPEVRRFKLRMMSKKENARVAVIETELTNNPHSSAKEIFAAVKSRCLFKDIYDLQNLLDWLHKRGRIMKAPDKKYVWVG